MRRRHHLQPQRKGCWLYSWIDPKKSVNSWLGSLRELTCVSERLLSLEQCEIFRPVLKATMKDLMDNAIDAAVDQALRQIIRSPSEGETQPYLSPSIRLRLLQILFMPWQDSHS